MSAVDCHEKTAKINKEAGAIVDGLPNYTEDQVLEHGKNASRIWVSYKNGVYDITDFIESHPGNKFLLFGIIFKL